MALLDNAPRDRTTSGGPVLLSPREIDPLVVQLDQFQGPLDLLLHLIRKQDIDIFDIPIATITRQFLDALGDVTTLELERAGEFIEMAATLVRIKAQMLFPRREEEGEDDPRADLVRRLLEFEHFREIARMLDTAARDRTHRFAKAYIPPRATPAVSAAPLQTSWEEVWQALLGLAERLSAPQPGYVYRARPVRLEEKIDHILLQMSERARVEFSVLVAPWGTRMHAVMSLLACLELAKRHSLKLRQSSPFAPLWLYRREGADAA